jgi:hypothetical protein
MLRASALSFAALACLPLLTAACGSSACTDGMIVANEANDYAFSSMMTLPPVSVMPMSDLTFDWGGVTQDFLGQPLDPVADLNTIFLLEVGLPAATFEGQLNDDSFATSSIVIPGPPPSFVPTGGVTSTTLYSNFITGDGPVDATLASRYLDASMYTAANATFAVVAQTGTDIGNGIRMLQSFELDPSSTNTTVTMTNDSTRLSYTADLHSLHPTRVPSGTAALTLDWGRLSTNALGHSVTDATRTNIGSAIVGHYSQTPAELENQFLDLRTIATEFYTANIPSGMVLDFTTLVDGHGNSFQGIDSTGTWLVGLICTPCRNPAPWYLTILEPAGPACVTK